MARHIKRLAPPAIAFLVILAVIGGPIVSAQSRTIDSHAVEIQHEGHCHIVSGCDAVGSASHAGPSLQNQLSLTEPPTMEVKLALGDERPFNLEASSVFRPPIA